MCEHLDPLKTALLAAGMTLTFSGQAWSKAEGEWAYFDCWLDRPALRAAFGLPDFVVEHDHRGTHDGSEAGFVCESCGDAVMGLHESDRGGKPVFPRSDA